jgi:molybdenum storage protein
MTLKRDASGRLHIETPLMAESLMDRTLQASTETGPVRPILPDLRVVKIGGQSIIDRGAKALLPVLDELVALRPEMPILITTGGGTRSRHVYAIAIDLGMPAGVLAKLGSSVSEQNALMVALLLAGRNGIKIGHDDIPRLAAHLAIGCIPVTHGMAPYGLFEEPPAVGRIPPHRTDVGTFLLAEVLGTSHCILIKDEDGLYTADPKKDSAATLIPEIEVDDLLSCDLPDLPVERSMLRALASARSTHQVRIVNGLRPGDVTRALRGEPVGTRVYRKEPS